MMFDVYWRSRDRKDRGMIRIEASGRDKAYDMITARLGKDYEVMAVYVCNGILPLGA